jgi:hypothetical protein
MVGLCESLRATLRRLRLNSFTVALRSLWEKPFPTPINTSILAAQMLLIIILVVLIVSSRVFNRMDDPKN